MSIAFSCSGCGHEYTVGDQLAGRRVRCKRCGEALRVPIPEASKPAAAMAAARDDGPPAPARPGPSAAALVGAGLVGGATLVGAGALGAWLWLRGGAADQDPDQAARTVAVNPAPPEVPVPPGVHQPPGAFQPSPVPPPPPVLSADLSGTVEVATEGDSYPELPPAPTELTAIPGESIRADVVRRAVEVYNKAMDQWDQIPPMLQGVHDAAEAVEAIKRIAEPLKTVSDLSRDLDSLDQMNRTERGEFARLLTPRIDALTKRLTDAANEVGGLPGLPTDERRRLIALHFGAAELQKVANMGKADPGRDQFVEIRVSEVPDIPTSRRIADRLRALADSPAAGGLQAVYNPRTRKASYRLWRVADQAALAAKIDFGKARDSLRYVHVVVAPPGGPAQPAAPAPMPGAVSALAAAARGVSANARLVDDALAMLASGGKSDRDRALTILSVAIPEDAHRAEVVKAAIALAESADAPTAVTAVGVLGRWRADEGIRTLIRLVETSNESRVRRAAITQLGQTKAVEAAAAIAARLGDDEASAYLALRQLGPAGESAAIDRLGDPDGKARRYAARVLRDIGGPDALKALEKLPAEPDPAIRRDIEQALAAVRPRVDSGTARGR